MKTIPYISIKSVLYDLSRIIPEAHWNETDFLEWAVKGLRRTNIHNKYQEAVCYIPVEQHKAVLPSDLRYLTQILYKKYNEVSEEDIIEIQKIMNLESVKWSPAILHMDNPQGLPTKAAQTSLASFAWRPMKGTTNSFLIAISCTPSLFPQLENNITACNDCAHEFTVDANGIITTTLNEGVLAVSYLRFPKDDALNVLIPDSETLKEAIVNYCLWMYYTKRDIMGEINMDKKLVYYKQMFGFMAAKASAELNSPDLTQMENLKNMMQRLVPRSNQYNNMFSKLSNKENLRY